MKLAFSGLLQSAVFVLLFASAAAAQSGPQHDWSHGTTLAAAGGVGQAGDDTGALLGGTIGWEISPRVGIDGAGTWFDRETGATAFAASLNVHAMLTKSQPVAPFVAGGFGMYLAVFDPNRATHIPTFYADRMSGPLTQRFTDPAFFASAGIEFFRTGHFTVRPAVGAVIAMHGADTFVVGSFIVQLAYHFEDHPLKR